MCKCKKPQYATWFDSDVEWFVWAGRNGWITKWEKSTTNFIDSFPKSVALGCFVYIYHSSAVASVHAFPCFWSCIPDFWFAARTLSELNRHKRCFTMPRPLPKVNHAANSVNLQPQNSQCYYTIDLIRAQNIFVNLLSPLKEVIHMSVDFTLFFFIFWGFFFLKLLKK